jgi:hypothetical protein
MRSNFGARYDNSGGKVSWENWMGDWGRKVVWGARAKVVGFPYTFQAMGVGRCRGFEFIVLSASV